MTRGEAAARARAQQTALRLARRNELADRVSDGMTIRAAAKDMGIGESTALAYWREIKTAMEFNA